MTNRAEYRIGYVPGRIYVLRQDVTLRGTSEARTLYTKGSTRQELVQGPAELIPAGTRIRIHGLYRLRVAAAQWEAYTSPLASFVDGPRAGMQVQLADGISVQVPGPDVGYANWVDAPNPGVLVLQE